MQAPLHLHESAGSGELGFTIPDVQGGAESKLVTDSVVKSLPISNLQ